MLTVFRDVERWLRGLRLAHLAGRIRNERAFRRTFLKYLAERRCEIVLTNDDHRILFDANDSVIGERILHTGNWHRDQLEAILAALGSHGALIPGGAFIDVGANIGTQTIYAMKSGLFVRAVALEPEPHNFDLLNRNIALNDLAAEVVTLNVAAGRVAEMLPLTVREKNLGGHSIGLAPTAGERVIEVAVKPLADLLEDCGVDRVGLLWVDTEGFEPEVLAGAWPGLAPGTPICLEFSPDRYDDAAGRELVAALSKRYQRMLVVTQSGQTELRPLSDLEQLHTQTDVVVF